MFAVEVVIKSDVVTTGIPNLRIYAHRCVVEGNARILGQGKNAGDQTAAPSSPAAPGFLGGDATNVLMACGSIDEATATSSLEISLFGGRGGKGGTGRNGAPGTGSTKGANGECKGKGFKCVKRGGQFGRFATNGENGVRGGTGGKGGKAGILSLHSFDGETSLDVSSNLSGGLGGTGGTGGSGGRAGSTSQNAGFRDILSCKNKGFKCKFTFVDRKAPTPRNGRTGSRGSTGGRGENGAKRTGAVGTSGDSSPREFYRLLVKLLERHADDLLFAQEDTAETMSVLKSIVDIGKSVDGDAAVKIAADRAAALHTRLTAGLGFFGAASLSRTAPSSIEEELNEALEFAEQVNAQLQASKTNANLQNVIATAAGIAVPKIDFDRLDSVFKDRRDTLVVAVKSLNGEIEASLSDISARIIEAKNAQEDADVAKQIDQILGLVSAGAGLGGAVAGKDPFAAVQSTVEIVQITNEIVEDAKSSGCSIGDLEALLSVDPNQRKEFPNTVADFEQDFSKLQGVGSVAEFSQAQLSGRAEQLTAQLFCVFDADLIALPNLQASINRFFINSAARLDVLDNILDIDLERAQLRVQYVHPQAVYHSDNLPAGHESFISDTSLLIVAPWRSGDLIFLLLCVLLGLVLTCVELALPAAPSYSFWCSFPQA